MLDLKIRQLAKLGEEIPEETRRQLSASIEATYADQLDSRYAAARGWVDRIILPHQTREALALSLEVAALNPHLGEFRTGVLQV